MSTAHNAISPNRTTTSLTETETPIVVAQNSPEIQRLFVAQRAIYSQAKRIHNARLVAAIVLASVSPLVLFLFPGTAIVLGIVGVAATVTLEGILASHEESRIRKGARIQEEIDTRLFHLPWNQINAGSKVLPEDVIALDRAYTGNRSSLLDWYADPSPLPRPLDVLLCQRANLTWDSRLRRVYGARVVALTLLLVVAAIVVVWFANPSFRDTMLAIVVPMLPALNQGRRLATAHFSSASEKDRIRAEVASLLSEAKKSPHTITAEQCRIVQNRIFDLRSRGPLVPDWWYKRLRDGYEIDMRLTVAELRDDLLQSIKGSKVTDSRIDMHQPTG